MAVIGALGILVFLLAGWGFSSARRRVKWRTVAGAFALQVGFGALVFGAPWGRDALDWLSRWVSDVIGAGREGAEFLFGPLSRADSSVGFVFAFTVLPMIVFFSSLIAVLYHVGVMQRVIRILGGGIGFLLGTGKAESMSAAANIFVGQTEAPMIVKPYLAGMTRSGLFAVMVGGLASIAGSVMAGYAAMGVEMKYLLAASFMSAPGGLLFAKLMEPETGMPEGDPVGFHEQGNHPANVLDAAAEGASQGLRLAMNVGAMLLAFVSLIALLNLILGGLGARLGVPQLSLQWLLGHAFSPVAWLSGVPAGEMHAGGRLIGQKLVMNEFVAYLDFTGIQAGMSLQARAVCSVALCGFANLSSIAILLGGLGGLAPTRRAEIAQLGLKAVFAATLANLTSAAVVGWFAAS